MAIIIPSKNIYSIDFNPVIDNQIDKVEIAQKKVNIVGNTENVYSNSFNGNFHEDFAGAKTDSDADKQVFYVTSDATRRIGTATIAYAHIQPTYITKTISIPETKHNKKILTIFDRVDSNGNGNISTHITGSIEKGKIDGIMDMHISSKTPSYELLGYSSPSSKQYITTEKKETSYGLPHTNETYKIEINGVTQSGNRKIKASVTLSNKDNIFKAKFNKVEKNSEWFYECELTCLVGLLIEKFSISYKIDVDTGFLPGEDGAFAINIPIKENSVENSYELYTPKTINISVNGETIGVDLQNETVTIGNGNKTYSFDGNELIQTTNTPTAQEKYQKIIDKWKNGKQTATITCPIIDFYDENGDIAINTSGIVYVKLESKTGNNLIFRELGTKLMNEGMMLINIGNRTLSVNATKVYEDHSFDSTLVSGNSSYLVVGAKYSTTKFLNKAKMMFDIGDIVIPYTYTNQGDKPIAYNKDFTPKQFEVVGTNILKSQGCAQELTLVEI